MEFIESPIFTRWLQANVTDEELRAFQNELVENPEKGDLIKKTGGFRKIRIAYGGQGKRGAGRVIYYFISEKSRIHLVMGYSKNEQSNLTDAEKAILKGLAESLN